MLPIKVNTLELSVNYDYLLTLYEVGFNLLVSSNTLFSFSNLELFMSIDTKSVCPRATMGSDLYMVSMTNVKRMC